MSDIKIYDSNPIPVEKYYHELMSNIHWTHSGKSGIPSEKFKHWSNATSKNNPIIKEIWNEVQRQIPIELTPTNILLNLYNHGDSSHTHIDSTEWTIIVYMNPTWDINWGGYTVFMNKSVDKIIYAVYPKPGSFVMFKSNILHKPTAVERETPYPRFGLTFQCNVKTSS